MYIDTHCHIFNEYYNNIDDYINEAKKSNVNYMISNAVDLNTSKEVLSLIDKYDNVYGAIGFHPTEISKYEEKEFIWLEKQLSNKKIIAIGEIGLDYHYDNKNKELQKKIFKRQLEMAEKYNKPIIVHTRDSIQDTYNILKSYNASGIIHCFSGSLEMAKEFIKLGYLIGIGGIVTYKNAKNIIEVIKNIDLEYIVLETDSPYLTPEPYRKEQNQSKSIPIIAQKIADIKNVDVSDVMEVTTKNVRAKFDFYNIL